ncbi:MAG: hypothetical protein ACYDH2_00515 [Anaerolineaceae bacterium]
MNKIKQIIFFLGSLVLFMWALTGCTNTISTQISTVPPVCVNLEIYSSVIEQQMQYLPGWAYLGENDGFSQFRWIIQNTIGTHSITTVLSPDGCICATKAESQFHFGNGEENLVGLLEGAAVVPISDLNFTAKWLEPKIAIQCTIANIFHRTYNAESTMKDGTTWKLTCSRPVGDTNAESTYNFSVTTPDCLVP